jgi:hypothetical protein
MGDKLKTAANVAFGIAVVLGLLALSAVFLNGLVWASENLLPPLVNVGWITLAVILLILLPLSLFRRLRAFTGGSIFLASYLFGVICWLMGFIVTYTLWGMWAIIAGLLFLGGGVVPIGMLASVFKGQWQMLSVLTILLVLTFGSRLLGLYITNRAE